MHLRNFQLFSIVAVISFTTSCGDKTNQSQQGPPPAVSVTVEDVQPTDAVYYDEYPGNVVALNEIKLTAQVGGYVTGIFFQDGGTVRKGQKLYSIDPQVYNANYQQAMADLQVQQANLTKAQKDADRYHELDKHDAIAKQQVDYADAALEVAKKQVAAATASVSAIASSVSFSTITAPFDGTIGISQVKIGTLVVAGQTIFNTVSTNNPMAVDFSVDQKNIYQFLQMEQGKNSLLSDSTFTIAFAGVVYPAPGKINLIDRAVDPQTGTIKIRLAFPNEKGLLKPGMNTTVRVKNTSATKATQITFKAVSEQLGEFFVYKVGDSNKVHQQKVQLGKQIGSHIIVTDGLQQGDKIVVQGVQNLHEGTAVKIAAQQVPPASKN